MDVKGREEVMKQTYVSAMTIILLILLTASMKPAISMDVQPSLHLKLPPSDWKTLIANLSNQLHLGIVSFECDAWKSRQFDGSAGEVLNSIAVLSRGRCVITDVGGYIAPTLDPRYELETQVKRFPYSDPLLPFLQSLNPQHLVILRKGESVKAREIISGSMYQKLLEVGKEIPNFQSVIQQIIEKGVMRCYLGAGVAIFWRGEPIRVRNGKFAYPDSNLDWHRRFLVRDVSELIKSARRICGNGRIRISKPTWTVGELVPRLVTAPAKEAVVVSKLVRSERIVVSKGVWDRARLLALLQAATHTELRKVGELFYIGRTQESMIMHQARNGILRCEYMWKVLKPIIAEFIGSPINETEPFEESIFLQPKLVPFSTLSFEEKLFVLSRYGIREINTADSERASECECFIHPLIWVIFYFREGTRVRQKGKGIGPTYNYCWLFLNTHKDERVLWRR